MGCIVKQREFEITTDNGPFRFLADSKELAHAHAMQLRSDKRFVERHGDVIVSDNVDESIRHISVRFKQWVEL